MTFGQGALPFTISKPLGDVPIWPLNSAADEYAVSPIDVIRSFLTQHELVHGKPSPWRNLIAAAAFNTSPALICFFDETESSYAYYMMYTPPKLIEWERVGLLEWHHLPGPAIEWSEQELTAADYTPISFDDPGDDPQLVFPLKLDFSPSRELLDLWSGSLRSYATESDLKKFAFALAPSNLELQEEFTRTLQSTLGLVAQQIRYEQSDEVHITRAGRFTPRLQLELCEQFLVGGYEATAFLTLLGRELASAIADGTEIQGGWGHIEQNTKGDLVYVLNRPNIISDPSFVRANRVE
jgi:hypothetical protein